MSHPSLGLILLPGLGADERLFAPQRLVFPQLVVPPWLVPLSGESLEGYARRFAAKIRPTGPLILGGCSLGGMVAYEMARHLRPAALVLISSAASRQELPWHLRALSVVATALPARAFGLGPRVAPLTAGCFGLHEREQRRLFVDMLRATPDAFLRWGCVAVGRWSPAPLAGVPILRIHGGRDWILPRGRRCAAVVVPDAGHALPMTHAETVNEWLLNAVKHATTEGGRVDGAHRH